MIITWERAKVMAPHHVAFMVKNYPDRIHGLDILMAGYEFMYDTETEQIDTTSGKLLNIPYKYTFDLAITCMREVSLRPMLAFTNIFLMEFSHDGGRVREEMKRAYPGDWRF